MVVLVDNYPYAPGLATAWGFSAYVEAYGERILFDTGPSPDVLIANAKKLGANLSRLTMAVISHAHGDHTGGLEALAWLSPGLRVYVPRGSGLAGYVQSLGLRPVVVNGTTSIAPHIYVVGPLYGPPWEQALAVDTAKGLILLVGCSHPGVVAMVGEAIHAAGRRVYMVVGGFHMAGATVSEARQVARQLVELGVEKIYPLHCSGDTIRHVLEQEYPEHYGDGGVGLEIVVPAYTEEK